jgi:hypothetical protein
MWVARWKTVADTPKTAQILKDNSFINSGLIITGVMSATEILKNLLFF